MRGSPPFRWWSAASSRSRIMDGPLWLRWVALAVFIAAGDHRLSRRLFARIWDQQSALRPDARSDRRQAPGRLLPADAGRRRHHPWLVAVGRHRHPVPRDPGVGPARISRRAARQRTRDPARQVEDHDPAGRDRLPARGRGRRHGGAGRHPDRAVTAVARRRCSRSIPARIISAPAFTTSSRRTTR